MDEFKVLLSKFLKGFIVGFFAVTVTIIAPNISNLNDLATWLYALGLAGLSGGIVGGIQSIWKAITWKSDEEYLAEIEKRINK